MNGSSCTDDARVKVPSFEMIHMFLQYEIFHRDVFHFYFCLFEDVTYCRDLSKKRCKDQESIQSSTTPDPGYQWESDKLTEDTTNESQEVSPFPAGDHKAHINRRAQT